MTNQSTLSDLQQFRDDLPKGAETSRRLIDFLLARSVEASAISYEELVHQLLGVVVALEDRIVDLEIDRDDLQIRVGDIEGRE